MENEAAPPPSWRMLESRSSSLPRIRLTRRNSLNSGYTYSRQEQAPSTASAYATGGRRGVRSWAKSWLPGPRSGTMARSPTNHQTYGRKDFFCRESAVTGYPDAEQRLSPPQKKRPLRRTPVLSLALVKLEEQMPVYCQLLSDPSHANLQKACNLLDSTISTASPACSETSSPSPAAAFGSSPLSTRSSPSRSPIRTWLTGSTNYSESPPSSSALALEGEWETFVEPFMLLAGAEGIYASLGHLSESQQISYNLMGLYEKIGELFCSIRETLCDPLLATAPAVNPSSPPCTSAATGTSSNHSKYLDKASSMAHSIHTLVELTEIRSHLIQIQSRLIWQVHKPPFAELAELLQELLVHDHASTSTENKQNPKELQSEAHRHPDLKSVTSDSSANAMPITKALKQEILAWKHLADSAHALERCRFAETILALQRMKKYLDSTSETCLQRFIFGTFRHLKSMLPIMFDRVDSFSKPFYGFQFDHVPRTDKSLEGASSTASRFPTDVFDLDSLVIDFLHRQEKAGGPTLAVSVVVDAESTSNLYMERGFRVADGPNQSLANNKEAQKMTEVELARRNWPAVYMRTTTHHGMTNLTSPVSTGGLLSGMRRSTSRKDRVGRLASRSQETEGKGRSTFVKKRILGSWSHDIASPPGSDAASHLPRNRELRVLEYAPEEGSFTSSWPHPAWDRLVTHITTGEDFIPIEHPSFPTQHPKGSILERLEKASISNFEVDLPSLSLPMWASNSSFSDGLPSPDSPVGSLKPLPSDAQQASFHVTELSAWTWLVVAVKVENEGRWHQRRRASKEVEEDIHEFLGTMAPLLRVSEWFRFHYAQDVRQHMREASPQFRALHGMVDMLKEHVSWNADEQLEFLNQLKENYQLKSSSRALFESAYGQNTHKSTYRMGFRSRWQANSMIRSPRQLSQRSHSSRLAADLQSSAAAFFLGENLMHVLDTNL